MKNINSLPLKDCLSNYDIAVFEQIFKVLKQDLLDYYWVCNDLKNSKMIYLLFFGNLCVKLISLKRQYPEKSDILEPMIDMIKTLNHKTLETNFNSVFFTILPD